MQMRKNRRHLRWLAAAVLCILSASPLLARSVDPKLKHAVEKANSEWAAAIKTGDAKTIAAPYKDDAVFVLADGTCIKGRVEIEKMYRIGFERGGLASSAKLNSKKLIVDGELAYEFGSGEVSRIKEGKTTTIRGKYLTVWQRSAGGEWKILRNLVF